MRQPYLVYVERVSVYRVWAEDGQDPMEVYIDTNPEEIDQETTRMDAEPDLADPEDGDYDGRHPDPEDIGEPARLTWTRADGAPSVTKEER